MFFIGCCAALFLLLSRGNKKAIGRCPMDFLDIITDSGDFLYRIEKTDGGLFKVSIYVKTLEYLPAARDYDDIPEWLLLTSNYYRTVRSTQNAIIREVNSGYPLGEQSISIEELDRIKYLDIPYKG